VQEQRVAACDLVAGLAEGVLGIRRQRLARKLGGRALAQRGRPDDRGQRIRHDLREERGVLARLGLPDAGDDQHLEILDPGQQVREPAQRGQVGPVQVVDHEQERLLGGDVGRQPVETVQHPQGDVCRRLRKVGGLEERDRELRRAGEHLGALLLGELNQVRLEQLPDESKREGPLELGAASAEHLHSGGLCAPSCLRDQRGLADPGRPLERQQTPGTADQRVDGRQLAVPFQENRPPAGRLRLDPTAAGLLSSTHVPFASQASVAQSTGGRARAVPGAGAAKG
jgi:hypothetical protein